jgi:membrane-associated protease RseP (regulator of RpoE activity)
MGHRLALLFFLWLGLFSRIGSAQEPQSLGAIGIADERGIRLTQIVPNGAAAKAGLAPSDVITKIDGKPVKRITEKTELATGKKPGSQVVVTYIRGDHVANATLLIAIPNEPTRSVPSPEDSPNVQPAETAQPRQVRPSNQVSSEFAKAANLALVAIKNSDFAGNPIEGRNPDQTVAAAINNADAAAVSESETAVFREIKVLSIMRPMVLQLLDLTAGAPAGTGAHDQWEKSMNDLQRQNECIAGWRLALRSLSGDKPKQCDARN